MTNTSDPELVLKVIREQLSRREETSDTALRKSSTIEGQFRVLTAKKDKFDKSVSKWAILVREASTALKEVGCLDNFSEVVRKDCVETVGLLASPQRLQQARAKLDQAQATQRASPG